eukprot:scaffold55030_cov68-Phaeocystis_antarctica.AAC.2
MPHWSFHIVARSLQESAPPRSEEPAPPRHREAAGRMICERAHGASGLGTPVPPERARSGVGALGGAYKACTGARREPDSGG